MQLKYFEWKKNKKLEQTRWDPTANFSLAQVRIRRAYIGPVRPPSISPARWAAMVSQSGFVLNNFPTER